LTGAALLVAGVCILIDRKAMWAATGIGITILAFDLLIWVPQFIVTPGQLAGNWLKDLGVVGGTFILAGALRKRERLANAAGIHQD
jgi:hypothetical protein